MGQVRKQNKALTPGIILALDKVAEDKWEGTSVMEEQEELEEMMAMVILTFCGALRGEEVSLVSLTGLLTFWEEVTTLKRDPHILVTLYGKFKGESGVRWHCIPVALNTRSGLPVGKWLARLVKR